MKFLDTATNLTARFTVGRELVSGRCYLCIPVSSGFVDYEEYYEITRKMHDAYPANDSMLQEFATKCRQRQLDHLLLIQPGSNRGVG